MQIFGWMIRVSLLVGICLFIGSKELAAQSRGLKLMVLGNLQDGGRPHMGCRKACCAGGEKKGMVTSLAVIHLDSKSYTLFEATPDIVEQTNMISKHFSEINQLSAIFLTHAHIGHYAGLMYLGREAMNTRSVPVYAMPRMKSFLESNGPWQQLVTLDNIRLKSMQKDSAVMLERFSVTPFIVPHRDEYSETVGYKISGSNKSVLFIPDINKWLLWGRNLAKEISQVDMAFLDGTFFANGEVDRPMSEIPHPFVKETMDLLDQQPLSIRKKVVFIHLNHTNPLLDRKHPSCKLLEAKGYRIAREGDLFDL